METILSAVYFSTFSIPTKLNVSCSWPKDFIHFKIYFNLFSLLLFVTVVCRLCIPVKDISLSTKVVVVVVVVVT